MNECCQDQENRADGPGPRGLIGLEGIAGRDDTTVTHCMVCDCRHVEATADTGELGLVGTSL